MTEDHDTEVNIKGTQIMGEKIPQHSFSAEDYQTNLKLPIAKPSGFTKFLDTD